MSTYSVTPAERASGPTVSPADLGQFLDAAASAPVALRDVQRINSILARLVGLANAHSESRIGELPDESSPTIDVAE